MNVTSRKLSIRARWGNVSAGFGVWGSKSGSGDGGNDQELATKWMTLFKRRRANPLPHLGLVCDLLGNLAQDGWQQFGESAIRLHGKP
jgi:hypothetical protein